MSNADKTSARSVPLIITLQYAGRCPHWQITDQRLRRALKDLGLQDVAITYRRVDSSSDAKLVGFHGSPTITFFGRDLFPSAQQSIALGCRIYDTEKGPDVAPSLVQLKHVLRRLL